MSFLGFRKFLLLFTLTLLPGRIFAQPPILKTLDRGATENVVNRSNKDNRIPLEVDVVRLLSSGDSTRSLFDEYYVGNISRIAEQASISDRPEDFDEEQASKAGQRALTMRISDSIHRNLLTSDLRPYYKSTVKEVIRLRKKINYSLQSNGAALSVSNKRKGKKLLEFDLEPNLKSVASPILRILNIGQIKVDPADQSVMYEFRRGW